MLIEFLFFLFQIILLYLLTEEEVHAYTAVVHCIAMSALN